MGASSINFTCFSCYSWVLVATGKLNITRFARPCRAASGSLMYNQRRKMGEAKRYT